MPLLGIAITWSFLNQQLLKLEKELGTPLFYRSRTDWHPTPAGEIYLNAAKIRNHL
ncbi:LysR family transcriptional regulator [Ruminococcus sp. AM09-18-1]|nr:LysR family transcriptional regulator [Ruminococcus sp. TF10-6]RGF29538.1 LysR family transcriptional regulator [Ruminococcus sp. AM09-18-1]RGF67998.1 LysR family transcriptional regulator [Ruminococcus sp. AF32-2AC]RGG00392.1 LysR family transcriptional regulator [Ruminococcus sp. AM49-8]RGG01930.1 LysR family transcriptional regulator [Ruminococcus sp. AM49-10BH]RGG04562.1 LysR family transcriptional regulator [Ruminococcus sp. AF27-3]RGG11759.1 LysR family transcriptional regulator [Rum